IAPGNFIGEFVLVNLSREILPWASLPHGIFPMSAQRSLPRGVAQESLRKGVSPREIGGGPLTARAQLAHELGAAPASISLGPISLAFSGLHPLPLARAGRQSLHGADVAAVVGGADQDLVDAHVWRLTGDEDDERAHVLRLQHAAHGFGRLWD